MMKGEYKGRPVKIHKDGENYIIEFENGASITVKDLSEVELDN